jgi:hypothetical protein
MTIEIHLIPKDVARMWHGCGTQVDTWGMRDWTTWIAGFIGVGIGWAISSALPIDGWIRNAFILAVVLIGYFSIKIIRK